MNSGTEAVGLCEKISQGIRLIVALNVLAYDKTWDAGEGFYQLRQ